MPSVETRRRRAENAASRCDIEGGSPVSLNNTQYERLKQSEQENDITVLPPMNPFLTFLVRHPALLMVVFFVLVISLYQFLFH